LLAQRASARLQIYIRIENASVVACKKLRLWDEGKSGREGRTVVWETDSSVVGFSEVLRLADGILT
jgi:hypothetical protein